MRRLLILTFLLASATVAHAQTTYYVSYSLGLNTYDGSQKSHTTGNHGPFKSAPGMQAAAGCAGATHSYTPHAGDKFIFRGGDTWGAACFKWIIPAAGSSGVQMYVGVDKTWYTGASWTRPIFDMANAVPTGGGPFLTPARYTTIDNLELKRLGITPGAGECADSNIDGSAGNVIVENSYIHDWTMSSITAGSTNHGTGSICQGPGTSPGPINAYNNVISDQNTTAVVPFGACFRNLTDVEGNDCEHTGEGEVGHFGNTDGNIFANINGSAVQNYDTTNHTNILETSGVAGNDGPIFNNLIYNDNAGSTIFDCIPTTIYNNVMWSDSPSYIMYSQNCGSSSSSTANIYNNTVDCSNSENCFRVYARPFEVPGILNLRNNIWITNNPSIATCYNGSATGCGYAAGGTQTPNYIMSTSEASTHGIIIPNKYKPSSFDSNVKSTGANLTSLFCGSLTALCSDAQGTFWFGGSAVARPTGSTAWDLGAYVNPSGGGGGPPTVIFTSPSAGGVSGTTTLTVTATPVSPATISNCQFSIDGFAFGSPDTSSPYSITWDTNTASNARAHALTAVCTDSNSQTGPAGPVSVTPTNTHTNGFVSDNTWPPPNQSFTAQTSGTVTYPICITPYTAATNDNEVMLSQALPSGYANASAIIAIRAGGYIQAYNGTTSAYATDATPTSYPVMAGQQYCFNWTINMTASTYTVAETSPSAVTIATGFGFRAAATSIGFLSAYATNNSTPDTVEVAGFSSTVALSFSPGNINFGAVNNTTTAMQSDSMTVSRGPATITSAVVAGTEFSLDGSSTCPTSGSINTFCQYIVDFTPPSTGDYNGTLTITSNATGSPQVFNLSGSGIASTSSATPAPVSLNFGNVQISTSSTAGQILVTLTNGPVTFDSTPVTFDNADFSVASSTCVGSVSAPTCQITPKFSPAVLGNEVATLTLHNDAPSGGSTQTVALLGSGVNFPSVAPATMFVFNPSFPMTVTLGKKSYTETYIASCSCQWANLVWGCVCQ